MKQRRAGSILILALAGAGIGLGVYLTLLHIWKLIDPNFVSLCEINQSFDCNTVNSSKYARVFGLPLGIYGAGFYGVLAVLSIMSWFRSERLSRVPHIMFGLSLASVAISVVLAIISHFVIGAFCLFCMLMWFINLAVCGISFWMVGGRLGDALRETGGELVRCYRSPGCYAAVFVFIGVVWIGGAQFGKYEAKAKDFAAYRIAEGIASGKGPGARFGTVELPDLRPTPGLQNRSADITIEGHEPVRGPANAPIVIVIFSDFECPYCQRAAFGIEAVREEHPRDVAVVFKHYPLDFDCNPYMKRPMHQHACEAAFASVCAKRQGRFWEMHDTLFRNRTKLGDADLAAYAESVGLDMEAFSGCLEDRSVVLEVNQDIEEGKRLSIRGTPAIYINGYLWKGPADPDLLKRTIDRLLGQ